jgi:hypothetical protein
MGHGISDVHILSPLRARRDAPTVRSDAYHPHKINLLRASCPAAPDSATLLLFASETNGLSGEK